MSERKTRVTVTLDPQLVTYAEGLVASGKADSVSAVVNGALEAERLRDARTRRLFREAAERADPEKVAHMMARFDEQYAALPDSHRLR